MRRRSTFRTNQNIRYPKIQTKRRGVTRQIKHHKDPIEFAILGLLIPITAPIFSIIAIAKSKPGSGSQILGIIGLIFFLTLFILIAAL